MRVLSTALAVVLAHGAPAVAQAVNTNTGGSAVLDAVVVRASDSAAVPNAELWVISLGLRRQTDSLGRVRLSGLPAGRQLIQVRRLGYVVARDTVSLESGRVTTRRYVLVDQATRLDTVHTVSSQQRYISPALRAFEARRLSGAGGHFISDSVLRANEGRTLADIVESRLPGTTVATGPGGTRVLVSTRKQCRGIAFSSCHQLSCYSAVYVDGTLIFSPGDMAITVGNGVPVNPPPDLSRIDVGTLAGVEFYASAAGAPVGMQSSQDEGCGTLWLWTREK